MISMTAYVNFWRRKMTLPIAPGDVVLDIGSGGKPHPRANVLCERFVRSTRDRCGLSIDTQGKELVVGDIYSLPFHDHAFDYVICSHVTEHLTDPVAAIKEIQRVGRAGYIETPSELAEVLYDNPAHENVVYIEQQKLVFRKKGKYGHSDRIRPFVRRLGGRKDWRRIISHDEFFMRYQWQNKIDCEVVHGDDAADALSHTGDVSYDNVAKKEPFVSRFLRRYVLRSLSKMIYPDRSHYQLGDLLCCPACRGNLNLDNETIRCSACGVDYSYDQPGVPRLLSGDAAES